MSRTSCRIRAVAVFAAAILSVGFVGGASAEVPRLTTSTPSLIGGQVIGGGHLTVGASAGYPELRGEFFFGLGRTFDLAVMPSLTYGDGWLSGLNQSVGLNVDVPLRFTLATLPKVAIALRVVPNFRIGSVWGGGGASWGTGGTIGMRMSIPLPKLFSIVAGLETRGGFGSFHASGCNGSACNDNFFEGATYAVIGLETFIKDKWFFFLEYDVGGAYTSGNGYYGAGTCVTDPTTGVLVCGGGNGRALFNAHAGFGYMMH